MRNKIAMPTRPVTESNMVVGEVEMVGRSVRMGEESRYKKIDSQFPSHHG